MVKLNQQLQNNITYLNEIQKYIEDNAEKMTIQEIIEAADIEQLIKSESCLAVC